MIQQPYENLKFYQNICEIRRIVNQITENFDGRYIRLVSQMRDAARSAKQNIREGYAKDTAGEFIRGIKISRGSLSELEGDIDDCFEDKLISKKEHDDLKGLISKTNYQIDRCVDSVYKLDREGKWKSRFKKKKIKP
ncbi:MAG: four helix bundle protein [Candidatus Omnitrophica bacterium]|nr:four helix bundle protein [Candidatus Omnitrophota bacterium]